MSSSTRGLPRLWNPATQSDHRGHTDSEAERMMSVSSNYPNNSPVFANVDKDGTSFPSVASLYSTKCDPRIIKQI